jgi:predicted dithiol-disulfide oxidoreductase (DUF899 family)
MQTHTVVSREPRLAACKALLLKEKEFTHLRDKINAERLALPWLKVEKNHVFDLPKTRQPYLTGSIAEADAGDVLRPAVRDAPR